MVVVSDDDVNLGLSFRNLEKVAIVAPSELDVAAVVWARSLLVSRGGARRSARPRGRRFGCRAR